MSGFMSKEEAAELRKTSPKVDYGLTLRVCQTCQNATSNCTQVAFRALLKTECSSWTSAFKTCGTCIQREWSGKGVGMYCKAGNKSKDTAHSEWQEDGYVSITADRCDDWELHLDYIR